MPYGYTALNVMTGATLIRTHGLPGTGAALLFLTGAVGGWGAVAMVAGGPDDEGAGRWQGLWSGLGAFAAFAAAALIAHAVHGTIAFGLVALAATGAYFGVGALGPALSPAPAADGPGVTAVMHATAGDPHHQNERRARVHPD